MSKKTEAFLTESCAKRLPNNSRLKIRDNYSLPQVATTRTPQLDSYLKSEISQQAKTGDKDLAKIQTFVLDPLAPLTHLIELDAQGHEISHSQAINAAKAAIQLIGNASAKISLLRQTKVISQLNKSLLPLTEEDSNFEGVAPSLFGLEFAHKSKDHVEQVKALRSSGGAKESKQQFFRQGPPTTGGILPKTRERRLPAFPEGEPSTAECTKVSMDQVNTHVCVYNHLIMNFKSTLACYIKCHGVTPIQRTDLPLAGRLGHHIQNWSAITRDRWVLDTVQGYRIDFMSQPHQQSLSTPPHYSSEQSLLIQEELHALICKQAIRLLQHPLEVGRTER